MLSPIGSALTGGVSLSEFAFFRVRPLPPSLRLLSTWQHPDRQCARPLARQNGSLRTPGSYLPPGDATTAQFSLFQCFLRTIAQNGPFSKRQPFVLPPSCQLLRRVLLAQFPPGNSANVSFLTVFSSYRLSVKQSKQADCVGVTVR